MTTAYQQTDDAGRFGTIQACSSVSGMANNPASRTCYPDAPPGSSAVIVGSLEILSALRNTVMFQSRIGTPGRSTWPAGDWVVRLNVTTASNRVSWRRTRVCRLTRGGSVLETVASINLGGSDISLGSTGVKTMTLSGVESTGGVQDVFYIVLTMRFTGSALATSFAFTPDQEITTPFGELSDARGILVGPRTEAGAVSAPRVERGIVR